MGRSSPSTRLPAFDLIQVLALNGYPLGVYVLAGRGYGARPLLVRNVDGHFFITLTHVLHRR